MISTVYCILCIYKKDLVFFLNLVYVRAIRVMIDVTVFASYKLVLR
jgi:hypothetical protein